MNTHTIKISKVFFDDHLCRGLAMASGHRESIINETKAHYTVKLTTDDVLDLLSDADHYSTEWRQMGNDFIGVGFSAAATKKRVVNHLIRIGYPFTDRQIRLYRLHKFLDRPVRTVVK